MANWRSKFVFLSLLIFVGALNAHSSVSLKHSAGTLSAGGVFTFPVEWDPVHNASLFVNLTPEVGFFLSDNFELILKGRLTTLIHNARLELGIKESHWRWGLGLGFLYLFDVPWPVIPFLGFSAGYEMAAFALSTIGMDFDIPVGVLVPLNEHVALNFGITTRVSLVAQLKIFDKLRIEPGCFGITAFF